MKRVKLYMDANAPGHGWSDARIKKEYAWQLKQRSWARRDGREIKKARSMGGDALRRTSRSLATQAAAVMRALQTGVQQPAVLKYQIEYADGSTRQLKTKMPATLTPAYAKLLLHRAGIYAQVEAERQQAEAERIQRIGYSLNEQAEMLELVDAVRLERRPIAKAATWGAVCSPQPSAPAGAAPAGIVERLRVLKAQRDGVATLQ